MSYDIDKYPAQSGRVIGEDGETYNLVDLMQGGTAASNENYDVDKYPAKSGRVIGEDGKVYNLVDLLQGTGGGGGEVSWENILNKPATFPPSTHNHTIAQVTGLQGELNAKLTASKMEAIPDSTAEDIETLVSNFNQLLAALRSAGVMNE